MAKLSAADRKALPAADFAGPDRSFPVNDANHARANHARAALSMLHNAPASEQPAIRAKANRVLGRKSALTEAINRQS